MSSDPNNDYPDLNYPGSLPEGLRKDESINALSHTISDPIDFATNEFPINSNLLYNEDLNNHQISSNDAYNSFFEDSFNFDVDPSMADFSEPSSLIEGVSDYLDSPLGAINSENDTDGLRTSILSASNTSFYDVPSSSPSRTNFDYQSPASGSEILLSSGNANLNLNHQGNPLPTMPHSQTGLPRRRSRYFFSKSEGQAIPIPTPIPNEADPMQRWQESPPEDEPASVAAIMDAMKKTPIIENTNRQSRRRRSQNSPYRNNRSFSTTSRESSASSTDSAWSSAGTSSSRTHYNRRTPARRLRKPQPADDSKPRIFCCTFCCDRFGTRYEWVRHEKSLHLNLETWYCAPFGAKISSLITGKEQCAFCHTLEPTQDHISAHNYEACQSLSKELRSFRRKDHLVQHLRHVHQVQEAPLLVDDWKIEIKSITSRCGFCDAGLENWDERISHLAKHFRDGFTMKDWKGDHGFPPHIVSRLRNAYPPYLLAWEAESMIPFSATSTEVRDQYAQVMSRASDAPVFSPGSETIGSAASAANASGTVPADQSKSQLPCFLDIFTRRLGSYARSQMELGIIPTDEMFQNEARKVVFDSEDTWNQTIADNPAWLSAFRQSQCDSNGNR